MRGDPIKDVTWRAQVEARVRDLQDDLDRVRDLPSSVAGEKKPSHMPDFEIAERNIKHAHSIVTSPPGSLWTWLRRWASGSDVESAWTALHDAESALVMILSAETIKARLPDLHAGLRATLGNDGRREEYEGTLKQIQAAKTLDAEQREQIRVIKSAIDSTSDTAHSNMRNYRNWLLISSTVVIVGLVAAAIAHSLNPEFLYIAEARAHDSGGADVAQIEAAGAVGGLLMALFALIRLPVYSGPVALPLWQAMVRVPAGAAAGLAGALLLQGQVITSITPQTRSGLLGYAVLFGAAPQLVLRLLDTKVNAATAAARPKNDPLKTVPANFPAKTVKQQSS